MGMFDKFPYRNTRDLNLNWIIKKILYLEGVVGEAVSNVATFLSKKGGKMEGAIDMQNNRIFNVPTPAGDTDVASKKYVDDKSGNYLPLAGGTMTGAVNMGGNKITSVATPEADADAATKKYVDDHIGGVSGDYLPLSGGTMTGSINMNGQHISGLNNPTEDTQAARKGYVDAAKAEANAYTDTKADLPKTVSGTVVTMDDASDASLQGLCVYGKTTQDGTPTPEAPVEMVSVGSSGSIAVSISDSREGTNPQKIILSTPGGLPGIPVTSGGNYTDAGGQKWVCNVVNFASGVYVQRIQSITLTGSESIKQFATVTGAFQLDVLGGVRIPTYTEVPKNIMCNYYQTRSRKSIAEKTEIGVGIANKNGLIIYDDTLSTVTMLKDKLTELYNAGNPVKVLAILETPLETPIPENELAAYAAAHTNNPNTTIDNDAGAHMDVGYYTPNSTMRQSDIEKNMSEKLSKTGGTMTGAINMGSKKITNVADPEEEQDVATKKYVDNHGGGVTGDYLPLAGGTMTGAVNMGGNKITSTATPTEETDVATKKYVDENSGSVKEITYGQVTLFGVRNTTTKCLFRIYLPFSTTRENVNFENFSPYNLRVINSNGAEVSLTITNSVIALQSASGNIVDISLTHNENSTLADKMYLYAKAELKAGFTVKKI